ncbi:FtsH protease activity modulator HflK [Paraburkholderia phosphatilytica]|uniref:FtsH protease activity modulator HflK n=1 Tax=Paraburkholderia phosphatilytica TaxID=2282883 RepID=UPI000E53E4C8|nr:FtsH protease activity modulator HflK [Paraburkholderia phosphatilytica]
MNDYNERSIQLRLRALLNDRWGRGDGNNGDRPRSNGPNRPQNGKDNNEGPPDLDEMWRDFNRRIGRLFGRKGGGGGPRPDNGRGAQIGVGIVIGVLIAIYAGSGVFVVQEGQAGIVMQFGQYRDTVGQGVHWRLPYPFESHEIISLTTPRSVEIGRNNLVRMANVMDASMLTHDGDILDIRFNVQYQISKPTDYLFNDSDPDQSVTQAAQAAVRSIVGTSSTDEVLYQDREVLRQRLIETIQHTLDQYRSGLSVTGVTLEAVQPPGQVQSAFDDAAKAHDDIARAKADAQAYANQLRPRVQADAAHMIDDAKSYSARVVEQAQGDAQRFNQVYAQYSKAPAVVRERIYLDTMQHIFTNTTKVFVDSKLGNNVLYLPLDKLVGETRAHVAAAAAAGANAGGASSPSSPSSPATGGNAPANGATSGAANGASNEQPGAIAPSQNTNGASVGSSAAAPNSPSTPAASDAAASDPLRSRDAFRSRSREDDLQ